MRGTQAPGRVGRKQGGSPRIHLQSILLYPERVQALVTRTLGLGIVEESKRPAGGYASQQGAMVLDWDAVCKASCVTPYNTVLHEFAHFLDYEDGWANGTPVIGVGLSWRLRKREYVLWVQTLSAEFGKLREQIRTGAPTFFRPYAATNAAEFFAVATEYFFCKPAETQSYAPELFERFKAFYWQDPSSWPGKPRMEAAIPPHRPETESETRG
jgi:MtfA peptidase